jgi:hypothetical protein
MSVASTGERSLEARTLRKVAARALPFLMALYFVNYLDRNREHVWHVAIPMLLGDLAIPVAPYLHSPLLVMIPVCITAMGVFSAIPSFWYRPDQLDRQPRRLRRPLCHRGTQPVHRQRQGRHVGGRRLHGDLGGGRRGTACHP